MFTKKMRLTPMMISAAAVVLGWGLRPVAPAAADLSSFGTTTSGMMMPDNSGSWGPFQTTNHTMTLNTQGIKGLTVIQGQKQIPVLPTVSDGWYGIAQDTPVIKLTAVVWAIDSSVWFNKPQPVAGPWQAHFTWHDLGQSAGASGGGFGFYFAVQHSAKGLGLIGQAGPNMGLTTAAVMSKRKGGYLRSATVPDHTLGIGINNTSGTYLNDNNSLTSKNGVLQVVVGKTIINVPVTGVDFLNATPKTMPPAVHISIAYNGAKTITFRAVQGKKTFTHSIQLPHRLSTVLGGPVGYVGFTGATADHRFGPTEAQGITRFSLHTGAPPAAGTPEK